MLNTSSECAIIEFIMAVGMSQGCWMSTGVADTLNLENKSLLPLSDSHWRTKRESSHYY